MGLPADAVHLHLLTGGRHGRPDLLKWLRVSPEGQAVEDAVERLLNASDG